MKNIVAHSALFRFPVKLICCVDFGSASSFCCLYQLQIIYSIFRNMDSLANIHLCNHHLYQPEFVKCYRMFLNYFLLSDRKFFSIDHRIIILYFHS